jgi:hypothetical protein
MMVTTKDSYIQDLTEKLNETANQQGYGPVDKINFVLAFVQSIPYSTDLNSTGYEEYPRFPIEVLVDQTGDCDCKSDLFATLIMTLGYGAVFINPPDHLAVGVLGDNLQGTYWTYQNQTYYYAETTGIGFKVGDLPDQFKNVNAYVYPIDLNNQYIVNSQVAFTVAPNPTTAPNNTSSAPTPDSGTTSTASPDITQPSIQPVQPISLNLISDYPILFVVIVTAIVFSIVITVKTATNPKQPKPQKMVSTAPTISQSAEANTAEDKPIINAGANLGATKFCIYCGSSNKSFASYCVKCGKKID